MAKAKARPKAKETPPDAVTLRAPNDAPPLERMRDLTRRVIAVPKTEVPTPARHGRKKNND